MLNFAFRAVLSDKVTIQIVDIHRKWIKLMQGLHYSKYDLSEPCKDYIITKYNS